MSDELRASLESAVNEFETSDEGVTNEQSGSVESESQGSTLEAASEPDVSTGTDDSGSTEGSDGTGTGDSDTTSVGTRDDTLGDADETRKADEGTKDPARQDDDEQKSDDITVKQHRVDRAPVSWTGKAKGDYNSLPLHVRQQIHKRDIEVERVLQETAPVRQIAKEFQDTVSPYMARINGFGVSPAQAVGELLKADYALASAPPQKSAALMAKLIKDYGIDLKMLDGALTGLYGGETPPGTTTPQGDPGMAEQIRNQVLQELSPVLTFAQQQKKQQQDNFVTQQNEARSVVETMSLDPKYPHFEEVRMDMADIIEMNAKRNVVISPEEAYNKAVIMNPNVADKVLATNKHEDAQKALNASSSVTGSPATSGTNTVQHDGTIRGAIESAISNL